MKNWYYLADNASKQGPFEEAAIQELISEKTITGENQVWNDELPAWQPLKSSELAKYLEIVPPPTPGHMVPKLWIWLLGFAPLWGSVISVFLIVAFKNQNADWATLVINVICCAMDERALKKCGYDTKTMGAWWLIPVYMWKRATVLKTGRITFWIWIVSFILSLISW
ncbi:MAG: DUF4339 domain-containing protein [Chthoniobacterales bacterium]